MNVIISASAVFSVVIVITAGYVYITANGDERKIEFSTRAITIAIALLVVAMGLFLIIRFIGDRLPILCA